jgi:peptidyl-prolyl cis-trans isomerase SurA
MASLRGLGKASAKVKTRNFKLQILCVAITGISPALAQMPSPPSSPIQAPIPPIMAANPASAPASAWRPVMHVTDQPVVRINGTKLTDRALLDEMLMIFPYARQHNGFPKADEEKIRLGALRMIEFEELVYQEAERRKMTVSPAKLQQAETDFRAQFLSQQTFDEYLKKEMKGSKQELRRQICRSLLVEEMLKIEIEDKSKVSLAEAHAYYDKNPDRFHYKENFSIQTISIMPSVQAGDEVKKAARKGAEQAWRKAKATKSYEEFGLLAENVSEDDFHVNMGDHKAVDIDKLPPEVVRAAQAMQPGQVSELLQLGSFYTFFRLNSHTPAGKFTFEQVKDRLRQDLQKEKYERRRAGLDKRLRLNAKVQEL